MITKHSIQKKTKESRVIFFLIVHDNFETIYELTIMAREVVEQVVPVHEVLDNDYFHMFDVNAIFANQLIFGVAKK